METLTGIQWIAGICMIAVTAAIGLTFIRLLRGPSPPDRIVALDVIAIMGLALIALDAIFTGKSLFLDVGLAMALIIFLATVAFAKYLEERVDK